MVEASGRKKVEAGPKAFGEAFKKRRIELGLTLRRFCRRNELDAGNISKLERGVVAPPRDRQRLEQYAAMLDLDDGSAARREFVDLGCVCAGRIPEGVMSDEELVKNLPLVFRTVSGRKPTREQLERLVDTIRKA